MTHTLRIAAMAAATVCAAPAFADTCRTHTLPAVLKDLERFEQTKDRAIYLQMGEAGVDCPNDPWIRTLLARAEIVAFDQVEPSNKRPNQLDPANYAYVERAAEHLLALPDDVPEQVRPDGRLLNYTHWSQSVRGVVRAMLRYADAGQVHPVITDTAPIACDFLGSAIALEASSYSSSNVRSQAASSLIDRTVPACRATDDLTRKNPLVQRAKLMIRRIDMSVMTDLAEIRRELALAARDVDNFRGERTGAVGVWFESDESKLRNLLRHYNVDLAAEAEAEAERAKAAAINSVPPTDRSLWFTPEHAGTDGVVHAMAISIAELWSPTAAGTAGASVQDVAQARVAISRHVIALRDEAKEKGVIDAAGPTLKAAVTAFQTGVVRTPETQNLPGMPDWLYNTSLGVIDR